VSETVFSCPFVDWWVSNRADGFSDTGVKAILKDVHDKIKALETELTEMHKLMAADPEAGISVLLDRPSDPYVRHSRSSPQDAGLWLNLIAKHKEYVPSCTPHRSGH
jgi:hypothetical protein